MIRVGVLTVSDKGSAGKREDKSGSAIKEMMRRLKAEVIIYEIIPDEKEEIKKKLKFMVDDLKIDLILTTGGTGLSVRDVTPEATKEVIEKDVPGLAEAMRMESFKVTPYAAISRAIAGIRKKTLIINLPGSPKGVRECLQIVLPAIPHAIEILKGEVGECVDIP
ncbi:MAG: molybdopterin adenylyltransferase [Candidatus Omnitrophica bacterium]|nr:molybdopterin adenylyltransferase [Candidatus Omnitrophota bacterium]